MTSEPKVKLTLEEQKAKLDEKFARAEERRVKAEAKLAAKVEKAEHHSDLDGATALWSPGAGTIQIPVTIKGYSKKVYGQELYVIEPVDGSGSASVALKSLTLPI